ncbi:hypothetical protein OMCYN_01677 [cyanobiont of Ornithocercus magnificus]|nr:hypothetical protein OMCYN_01677 [cyanobiont of Ornithocercus magnificus]
MNNKSNVMGDGSKQSVYQDSALLAKRRKAERDLIRHNFDRQEALDREEKKHPKPLWDYMPIVVAILRVAENEEEGVTYAKLQSLLYLVQGFMLALEDEAAFENVITAGPKCPLVRSAYNDFRHWGKNPIDLDSETPSKRSPVKPSDWSRLSDDKHLLNLRDTHIDIVHKVHDIYGQFSAKKLLEMIQSHKPWLAHKDDMSNIPQQEIKDFFKDDLLN